MLKSQRFEGIENESSKEGTRDKQEHNVSNIY